MSAFSDILKSVLDKEIVYSFIEKMSENLHKVRFLINNQYIVLNWMLYYY